jgi:uncharacterized membrane protein YsdA (DUF1294 family)
VSTTGSFALFLLADYIVMSSLLFALYGVDKTAARRGTRRIPEAQLHLLALFGGWPGGLAGQLVFHHKTRKQPFQSIFWVTVIVNVLVTAAVSVLLAG